VADAGGRPKVRLKKTSRGGSVTASFAPGVTASASSETQEVETPPMTATDALTHLPRACKYVRRRCRPENDHGLERGDWVAVSGVMSFGVLSRDTPGTDTPSPKIAYWRHGVPLDNGTARWIVLSGTADGNVNEFWEGKWPADRSGSRTEAVFDLCVRVAKEDGEEWLPDDHTLLYGVAAMAGMPEMRKTRSGGIALIGHVANVPPNGWFYSVGDRKLPVTQVLVGTPLYMATSTGTNDAPWRRLLRRRSLGRSAPGV